MKVADYIADFLYEAGVRQVFEVVGGMIAHLVDSIHQDGRVRLVSMHHEQAAAFAADAVGRLTGIPGVAMATSGPGAVNLLTGVGSCYFDSSPAVFITGQVNRNEQKGTRPVRQLGFQETDIVAMAAPITKAAWRIEAPEEVPRRLREAFDLAVSGRPGPVLLDIPMDVQRAETSSIPVPWSAPFPAPRPSHQDHALVAERLRKASRPLLLVGGGLRSARSRDAFRQFAERLNVPVVHSLQAVDALPYAHPLRVGMIGSYGNRWANLAVGAADLLLVLGSRLDVRQTGSETEAFKAGREIIHVDCEPGEINNRVKGCHPIVSHLRPFLETSVDSFRNRVAPEKWMREIRSLRDRWPDTAELANARGINPNVLMHDLSRLSQDAAVFVVDVGQHQMWAAQSLELRPDQEFLTSGGMGAMGFALPAAIGSAFARARRPLVMIAGDGGFQLNIQELQTVVRNRLPVKMLILNNNCHGMVRQFQQSYFEGRYVSTSWGYSAPEFTRVAEAYGVRGQKVTRVDQLTSGLTALFAEANEPFLLEVQVELLTNAYPKIAFGRPITEMEPFAKPRDIEGT